MLMMMKDGDNFKDQALGLVVADVVNNEILCTEAAGHCGAIVDNFASTAYPQPVPGIGLATLTRQ
jgi:hypothetical protein